MAEGEQECAEGAEGVVEPQHRERDGEGADGGEAVVEALSCRARPVAAELCTRTAGPLPQTGRRPGRQEDGHEAPTTTRTGTLARETHQWRGITPGTSSSASR